LAAASGAQAATKGLAAAVASSGLPLARTASRICCKTGFHRLIVFHNLDKTYYTSLIFSNTSSRPISFILWLL
jgi:hypothetical protein